MLVDQRVTKLMARISRISDELKVISLSRLSMSRAVCGTPLRTIRLMRMMTMSRDWQL